MPAQASLCLKAFSQEDEGCSAYLPLGWKCWVIYLDNDIYPSSPVIRQGNFSVYSTWLSSFPVVLSSSCSTAGSTAHHLLVLFFPVIFAYSLLVVPWLPKLTTSTQFLSQGLLLGDPKLRWKLLISYIIIQGLLTCLLPTYNVDCFNCKFNM